MQYELKINYKGELQSVSIDTSVYQGKQTYEVSHENKFFIIYKEEGKWQHDHDQDFDEEWLQSIGKAIESHPDISDKVANSQTEDY